MIRGVRAGHRQLSGFSLNIFTEDELAELHRATLEILEDAGLVVLHDEAQEIFQPYGCKVDNKANIVKIPPSLVEEAIESAPSKVLLAGRNPKYDVILEGTRVGFSNLGVAIKVLDLETEDAHRILKAHQPEPLSDDVKRALGEIVASAERELVSS